MTQILKPGEIYKVVYPPDVYSDQEIICYKRNNDIILVSDFYRYLNNKMIIFIQEEFSICGKDKYYYVYDIELNKKYYLLEYMFSDAYARKWGNKYTFQKV